MAKGSSRSDAERKLLGVGHDKVGARALEQWGAAPAVIECALSHHSTVRGDPWQLAIVQAADVIAAEAGWDAENLVSTGPSAAKVCERAIGFTAEDVAAIITEVSDEAGVRDPLW